MVRLCFLMVDHEYGGSISTRKLVIETAKLNVITVFSGEEALETLAKFPLVDGIVLDAGVKDIPCSLLIPRLKQVRRDVPVIAIGSLHGPVCVEADHFLESFDPSKLLEKIRELFPESTGQVQRHDEELKKLE